jgi:hypothetical protein
MAPMSDKINGVAAFAPGETMPHLAIVILVDDEGGRIIAAVQGAGATVFGAALLQLGPGPPSQLYQVGLLQEFVDVNHSENTSLI